MSLTTKIKFLLMLGALSCSTQKEIRYGEIVDKIYKPSEVYQIPEAYYDPDKGALVTRYKDVTDDEDYIIVFNLNDGKKIKKRRVHVKKDIYDILRIGAPFDPTKIPCSKHNLEDETKI